MDQLQRRGDREGLLRQPAHGFAGEHAEGRPQALPLAHGSGIPAFVDPAHVVLEHGAHARVVGRQQLIQGLFNPVEVLTQDGRSVVRVVPLSLHRSLPPGIVGCNAKGQPSGLAGAPYLLF